MPTFETPTSRLSALPWNLYQSNALASLRASDPSGGFYLSMLNEDLRNQRYAYDISLASRGVDTRHASEVLSALLNDFNHMGYARDASALVCEFAHGLLEESAGGKSMLLELHTLSDEQNHSRLYGFRRSGEPEASTSTLPCLGLIPRWSLTKSRPCISQASPHVGDRDVSIPDIRIHRAAMRSSNLPSWKRTVKELRQVDASKFIGVIVDRLSWRGYAFSDQAVTQKLAVAATTSRIGWDARGTFSELVTSPYLAFRRLRFALFWVETVEDSVAFLNRFTKSRSLYGSSAFSFSLSGMPSAQDLVKAMSDVRAGTLTVENAHKLLLSRRYTG